MRLVFAGLGAGWIWSWLRRLASFPGISTSRFGLNLFCGGAAQTIEHEKLRLDPWHATMVNAIILEEAQGRGIQDLETRCLIVLICKAVRQASAEGCKHTRAPHFFFISDGSQTSSLIGASGAIQAAFRNPILLLPLLRHPVRA